MMLFDAIAFHLPIHITLPVMYVLHQLRCAPKFLIMINSSHICYKIEGFLNVLLAILQNFNFTENPNQVLLKVVSS